MDATEVFKTTWHRDICVTEIEQISSATRPASHGMDFIWYETTTIQIDWRCLGEVHESIMDTILIAIDICTMYIKSDENNAQKGVYIKPHFRPYFDAVLLPQFCPLTSTSTTTN